MSTVTTSHAEHAEENRNRVLGVVLAAAGAGLFSLKGVVAKLAYAEHIGVTQLLTLRMVLALPFYLAVGVWAYRRAEKKPTLKAYGLAALLGVISYYVSSGLDFLGLQYVTAQLERLILYSYPTMVALMAWAFLGEKISARHVLALVLAYAGIAVLFGAEVGHQGGQVWLGGALVLGSAVTYAIFITASRSVIRAMGSMLFTSLAMTTAAACFLVQSGVEMLTVAPPPITANGYVICVVLAVVCTVIPSFMIADAIGRIGPGPMSAIGGIGPVVAAWAAVAILHEPFGWPHFVAMALTMFGIWLLARSPRPRMGVVAAKAASPTP